MSFAQRFIESSSLPVHFIKSNDAQGSPCYYVLLCSPQQLKLMLSSGGTVKPEDYGHVLDSGFGDRPPDTICRMLKEKYNFIIADAAE